MRISLPERDTTHRACVVLWPVTSTVTSRSIGSVPAENERYCAVAQIVGRPVTRSIAAIAAPSPAPPCSVDSGVSSSGDGVQRKRVGSSVGSSAK